MKIVKRIKRKISVTSFTIQPQRSHAQNHSKDNLSLALSKECCRTEKPKASVKKGTTAERTVKEKYEEKRQRKFKQHWKEMYPWLDT